MPPKALPPPAKGQMSLNSFFQKPAAAVATCTPAASSFSSSAGGTSSGTSVQKKDFVVPVVPPLESVVKAKPSLAGEQDKSKTKRARVIEDDDAEDVEEDKTSSASKKAKAKAAVNEHEEAEWDGEDSSEEDVDDDDSDASGEDEEDEEEEGDEEGGDDDSYGSDKKKAKSSKRKQPQKTSKASKAPRTVAQAAPVTTQKPTKGTTFVTPAPHSAKAPSTQMNDLFGLCHAGAETPSLTGSSSSSSSSSNSKPPPVLAEGVCGMGHHEHDALSWLQPDKRVDRNGKRMNDPEYNPRTLRVDPGYLKTATPAMAQWWKLKSENMDTVLFFKVGKFYELFHMDADVGMKELDLIYMKGDKAHSGFPEVSYGKFSSILVSKGYRVARVEQTETPEMLKDRNDSGRGPKDKVVAREMCSIMSKGTRTYCHLDDLSLLDSGPTAGSSVLFCIKEELGGHESQQGAVNYGICSVDCVLGVVTLALFEDDKQRTRLRTLLSKFSPNEVLLEKAAYSAETLGAVRLIVPQAKMEILQPSEVMTSEQTVATLQKNKYFADEEAYPAVLKAVLQCLHAPNSTSLLVSALGGALWQLSRSLIDYEILSLGKFCGYVPPDLDVDRVAGQPGSSSSGGGVVAALSTQQLESLNLGADGEAASGETSTAEQQTMTLDAVSLGNLEVLVNNFDRTEKGSLWAFMNKCKTPFGRRLLHEWIVRPLYRPADIQRRAHAVEELLTERSIEANACRVALKAMTDLERLLARVHSNGLKKKGNNHPEQRAIMYEAPIYNTRKIKDFADILSGFETLVGVVGHFNNDPRMVISSALLRRAVKPASDDPTTSGKFPLVEIKKLLRHFRDIFDEKQAKKEGNIKPRPGVSKDYDDATAEMSELHAWFENYLREQKLATGIASLQYWGNGKDRYQMEVPMDRCSKVPANWESKSQKKTHRRYWTSKLQAKLGELIEAEGKMDAAQKDTLRAIFAKFDESHAVWSVAVACMALLDALLSLASISALPNYCWPDICHAQSGDGVSAASSAELCIVNGRHPMLEFTLSTHSSDAEYIANSLHLGGFSSDGQGAPLNPRLMLLSGPNMGGKSTLLRQTCLIAIMAQMGCKVPADSVRMTPVDRIFTRVGASDRILAGQSTFFVELAETATILKLATKHSLCILDELGRGTATFDGTAIAHSVVNHLVSHTGCMAVFATHYHSLVHDWEIDPRVRLGHMSCMVDTSRSSSGGGKVGLSGAEEITFLYCLAPGSSPRSYGINVARLAQLPAAVIELACKQSKEFEDSLRRKEEGGDAMDVDVQQGPPGAASCTLVKAAGRDAFVRFFDRLVSLASSTVPVAELAAVAHDLWKLYNDEVARQHGV